MFRDFDIVKIFKKYFGFILNDFLLKIIDSISLENTFILIFSQELHNF